LFGSSLAVARGSAFVLGLVAAALVLAGARLLLGAGRDARWGALLAVCLPYSAWLGVATVPELPTAALTLFAITSLESSRGRTRLWGAAALSAACLCRYEPWMVAPWFVVVCLYDAAKGHLGGRVAAAAAAIALFAPLAWMAHNQLAHGDALHFAARVSAYREALGGGGAAGGSYMLDLARKEPELSVLGAAVLLATPGAWRSALARRRAWLTSVALFATLSLSAALGASATHHPERSLLLLWLLLAIAVGAGMRAALRGPSQLRFSLVALVALPLAALVLRPWYARIDAFIARNDEVALGETIAASGGAEPVLLEVIDYGFYAVQAGSGHPERFVLDRSIDPRKPVVPSSFVSRAAVRARCRAAGAQSAVGGVQDGLFEGSERRAQVGALAWWRCR
jgi:hypothetical protein